jgi:hypothetical protein
MQSKTGGEKKQISMQSKAGGEKKQRPHRKPIADL